MKFARILPVATALIASSFVAVSPASAEAVSSSSSSDEIVVVKRVKPKYPKAAIENEVEGAVALEFDIEANGFVENLRVVSSDNAELSDAALEAFKQWTFEKGAPSEGVNVVVDFTF